MREVQPLLAWVRGRLDDDVSLAALARRAALSPFHLHRVFARAVGETPKAYTLRLRLSRAAAALVAGRATILEVALDAGFQSHEVFIRAFRRRFGMTPRAYRDRGLAGDAARHAQVVDAVAPCIGLYGASLTPPPRSGGTMSHDVTREELPEQHTLYMRRRATQDEIAACIGDMLPRVFSYAQRAGIACSGPPYARYLEWGPGRIHIECGMPVAGPATGEGDIAAGTLPGGPVAVTIHAGAYDGLRDAHMAIEAWLEARKLAPGGAPWESYLTDPGDHPDPKDWKTAVYWPIAP